MFHTAQSCCEVCTFAHMSLFWVVRTPIAGYSFILWSYIYWNWLVHKYERCHRRSEDNQTLRDENELHLIKSPMPTTLPSTWAFIFQKRFLRTTMTCPRSSCGSGVAAYETLQSTPWLPGTRQQSNIQLKYVKTYEKMGEL